MFVSLFRTWFIKSKSLVLKSSNSNSLKTIFTPYSVWKCNEQKNRFLKTTLNTITLMHFSNHLWFFCFFRLLWVLIIWLRPSPRPEKKCSIIKISRSWRGTYILVYGSVDLKMIELLHSSLHTKSLFICSGQNAL